MEMGRFFGGIGGAETEMKFVGMGVICAPMQLSTS